MESIKINSLGIDDRISSCGVQNTKQNKQKKILFIAFIYRSTQRESKGGSWGLFQIQLKTNHNHFSLTPSSLSTFSCAVQTGQSLHPLPVTPLSCCAGAWGHPSWQQPQVIPGPAASLQEGKRNTRCCAIKRCGQLLIPERGCSGLSPFSWPQA